MYDTRQLLERERGLKADVEARQSATLTQLTQSGDKGKLLEMEIADLKKQLDLERYHHLGGMINVVPSLILA